MVGIVLRAYLAKDSSPKEEICFMGEFTCNHRSGPPCRPQCLHFRLELRGSCKPFRGCCPPKKINFMFTKG